MLSNLAFEMRERVLEHGRVIYDSEFFVPNQLTHEGQASMLNVWARGDTPPDLWMMLLNMPNAFAPTKASTLADITEADIPGTSGYDRKSILTGDWSAPSLSSGDMQISAAQKTFGPFSASIMVSHVGICSIDIGYTGEFFLFVSNQYHNANMIARQFAPGQSYQITFRDKAI